MTQSKILKSKRVAVDTETTGVLPWRSPGHVCGDRAFAASMCNEEGDTWYCEWPVDPLTRRVYPDPADVQFIGDILCDPKIRKGFFNAKFDLRMFDRINLGWDGPHDEVFFMAKLCNSQEFDAYHDEDSGEELGGATKAAYQLKRLAHKYCRIDNSDQQELKRIVSRCRAWAKKLGWRRAEWGRNKAAQDYWLPRAITQHSPSLLPESALAACEKYATLDAVRTMALWQMYDHVMEKEDSCLKEFYEIEMEAWWSVWEAEEWGFSINRASNSELLLDARAREVRLLRELRRYTKKPGFNPGSAPQLADFLYNELKLECARYSPKTEKPSANIDALKPHTGHPFVQLLTAWRSAGKSDSTFFGKYDSMMVPEDVTHDPEFLSRYEQSGPYNGIITSFESWIEELAWLIHCSINQVQAITGRTSASDPNLQQVADASKITKGTDPIQARTPYGPRRAQYRGSLPVPRRYNQSFSSQRKRLDTAS